MSDRITRWLDESQQLADQATEGPWEADLDQRGETRGVWPTRPGVEQIIGAYVAADGFDSQGWTGGTDENLTFIAEARTRLPQAVAALRAVMELHQPFKWSFGQGPVISCRACFDVGASEAVSEWPCQTARVVAGALTAAIGGDDE